MQPKELLIAGQLLAKMVHAAGALQHGAILQMEPERAALDLAIAQLFQLHPGDAALAAENQTGAAAFVTFGNNGVHQAVETLRPNRLKLVEIGAYGVGFHGKFRGGGEKNDFNTAVKPANLPGGLHTVFSGHQYIQKQNVEAQTFFNLRDQL